MQGPRDPSQQRGQNPTELPGHEPERLRRNPTASKTAAPDPSRQNSGLFHVEPPLWEMVCDEIQARRL